MSADGIRIFHVTSKTRELSKYMSELLDQEWNHMRGMEIQSVGIDSVSYDENSRKMIDLRNEGAMLSDPTVREGYVQAAMARGLEAAGSNANGSMAGFMGMGMGMNMSGAVMGQASQTNLAQMQMQQAQMQQAQMQSAPVNPQPVNQGNAWTCGCGNVNTGKFCSECGTPAPTKEWTCSCGNVNSGKFCSECGKPRA
jgi:membrane protease subunit (stomatin/prohibitin family)